MDDLQPNDESPNDAPRTPTTNNPVPPTQQTNNTEHQNDSSGPTDNTDDQEHRRLFMNAYYSSKATKDSLPTVAEYNEQIRVVRYWNLTEGHVDEVTGNLITQAEFRRSVPRTWYQRAPLLRINTETTKDGSTMEILERLDKNSQVWKRVVHIDNVFDFIKECHDPKDHNGTGGTKELANIKFDNITENLCKMFVTTCPKCCAEKSTSKTPRTPRKTTPLPSFFNKYSAAILDCRSIAQKDRNGVEMSFVLILYDKNKHWVVLRPTATSSESDIASELWTIFCTTGYPITLKADEIQFAAAHIASTAILIDENEQDQLDPKNHLIWLVQQTRTSIHATWMNEHQDHPNWVTILNDISMNVNYYFQERRKTKSKKKRKKNDTITSNANQDDPLITRELPTSTVDESRMARSFETTLNGENTPIQQQSTTIIDRENEKHQDLRSYTKEMPLMENIQPIPPKHPERHSITLPIKSKTPVDEMDLFPISHVPKICPQIGTEMSQLTFTQNNEVINNDESAINDQIENRPMTQSTLSQIDEVIDDKKLAVEIKAAYQNKFSDIRTFFQQEQIKRQRDAYGRICFPPATTVIKQDEAPNLLRRMTVKEAFKLGKTTTRCIDDIEYRLCHPKLICSLCDECTPSRTITVAEDEYYEIYKNEMNRWFYADMVSTFGVLCSHDAHRSDIMYVDATLPSITTGSNTNCKKIVPLPPSVQGIISVAYSKSHFVIMKLCLDTKKAYFYDGLSRSIDDWKPHMIHLLNQYGYQNQDWQMLPGPENNELDGITIKQEDQNNCGPIACIILWKLFKPNDLDLRLLPRRRFREAVIKELRRLLEAHDSYLVLFKRKRRKNSDEDSIVTTALTTEQEEEDHPILTTNNELDEIPKTRPPSYEKTVAPEEPTAINKRKKNRISQDGVTEHQETSPITDYFPKKQISTKTKNPMESPIRIHPKIEQKESLMEKPTTPRQNARRKTAIQGSKGLSDTVSSESDSLDSSHSPKEKEDLAADASSESDFMPTRKEKQHKVTKTDTPYDGLWDSSEEEKDDAFMETVTPSRLKKINRIPQKLETPKTKKTTNQNINVQRKYTRNEANQMRLQERLQQKLWLPTIESQVQYYMCV